jgi:hypothetical protein
LHVSVEESPQFDKTEWKEKKLYEYAMGTNKVTLIKQSGINKAASMDKRSFPCL